MNSSRRMCCPVHNGRMTTSAAKTVTLIGKPGCHLCDNARAVVEKVAGELGAVVEERDITQDEELYRKYWEQIPVVLVDGEQHDFWRVDERRLRAALTG
jgi:glutaredoxin